MAMIPLRTYLQEIQRMVDSQRLDEAIAHARHILLFYPRYIDVYRLLGKAYLKANRYGDAADIFQRVLSSLPEDYVSNARMSIIREDEGNMDEAIWHMERAFEIEPSNSAIQDELRRLIGRRDGIEPPKIRLTRGALARMYLKGDLIQEAIKEIRIALTEDNDRLDLKALLVVALHRAGQRVEAIDVARQVLKKLPNSLDANRIMAELLAGTDKDEEAQEYRRVVIGLNPYYNFVTPSTPLPEQVPSQAINLEKLDWKTGEIQPGAPAGPAWATSLGIDMSEPAGEKETVPDWLTTSHEVFDQVPTPTAGEAPGIAVAPDQSPAIEFPSEEFALPVEHSDQETEEELPEWMRQAGWDSTSEEEPLPVAEDLEIIPEEAGGFGPSDQELPAWLSESKPEAEPQVIESLQEEIESELAEQELPAWLTEGEAEAEPQVIESLPAEAESELAEQELPAWLTESEAEAEPQVIESLPAEAESELAEQELPAWLTEGEAEAEPQVIESLPAEAESEQAEQELPAWLSEREEETAPQLETEPYEATSAEALPEWVFESESTVSPENQLPPWLTEPLVTAESDRSGVGTGQPEAGAHLPSWLFVEEVSSTEEREGKSEIPDWLMEESPAETLASEAVDQIAETQADEIPGWLFEEIPPASPEPSLQLEEMPDERFTSQADESPALYSQPEEFVAQPSSTEETLPPAPETPAEQPKTTIKLPAWLLEGQTTHEEPAYSEPQELSIPGPAEVEMPQDTAETPTGITQEVQIPAWLLDEDVSLEDSARPERLPVEPPASVEEELPEWLAMMAETPLEEDDTQPSKVKKPAEIIQPVSEIPGEPAVESLDGGQTAAPHWLLEALEEQQEIQPDLSFDFAEPVEMAEELEAGTETLGSEDESFSEWQLEEDFEARLEGAAGPHLSEETQLTAEETLESQESEFFRGIIPALPEQYDVAQVESVESLRAEIMSQELLEEAEGSEEPLEMPVEARDEPSAEELPLEMPEWLVEPVEEPGSDFEWTPPPVPPSEFVNLNSGTLVELEKIPGIGFIRAQNIINYRENNGPFSDIAQLAQVPGMTADLVDSLKNYVYIEESIEEQPATAAEIEVSVIEKSLPDELQNARSALGEDDITAAIQNYSALIENNQYLPEIIHDLQEARDRHPDNPDIWLLLGDAYIRANQVQNALSAYRQAEKLLL